MYNKNHCSKDIQGIQFRKQGVWNMQEGFILFVDELSCLAATPFLTNVKCVDGYKKYKEK